MFEDVVVDDGNVQGGEDGDETRNDGPEEELVPPDVDHPLGKVALAAGLHAEETAAHVDHFPGQEQREPCERHECGGAGSEDRVTLLRVGVVASRPEIAVAKAVHDEQETRETQRAHPESVRDHIEHDFQGEDAALEVLGRAREDVGRCDFHAETHVGHAGGDHDDPQDFDGRKRKHGQTGAVFERQTDEQRACLCNVLGEQMQDEFLDVVEHAATFFDGVEDRGEVVVGQNDVGGVFSHVGPGHAHRYADVGNLQGGGVVDTVAGLYRVSFS